MPRMPHFMIVWPAPIFMDAGAIGWKFQVRGHHLEKAVEVAVGFGVAVPEELSEVAEEICNQVVMKPLERKRFLALLRPE